MMNTYRIEMMTAEKYHTYMMGGMALCDEIMEIKASSVNEAIMIAENTHPNLIANKHYISTLEELEVERIAREKAIKDEADRKAQRKAKAEAREQEKAEAMNLTIEEYRAEMKRVKKIKALEKQIAELQEELVKAEKALNALKNNA